MLKNLSFVVLLLALGQSAHGQVIQLGKCPSVKYLSEFDLPAYTGIWYEHSKYPLFYELGQKCIYAQYSSLGDNLIGVNNSGVETHSNWPVSIEGYANVLGAGRLAVVFGNTNKDSLQQNYAVLGTDYNNYALVYNCNNIIGGLMRTESVWILTRDRNASEEQVAEAKRVMEENGISQVFLTKTDQQNCPEPGWNN